MRRVLSSILMVVAIVLAFAFVVVLVASLATTDGSSQIAREGQTAVLVLSIPIAWLIVALLSG